MVFRGVIVPITKSVNTEWTIPYSLEGDADDYFDSRTFSSQNCRWNLRVYPKGDRRGHCMSVYLCKKDPETAVKTVTYHLGVRRADNTVEEYEKITYTFEEGNLLSGMNRFLSLDELDIRRYELERQGSLTITCRMEVPTDDTKPLKQLMDLQTLSCDFGDLLGSERNFDVTVQVQGREFRAHRTVLMARSSVFRAMLGHDTEEAESGIVKIPDCDPDSFADFLRYLYTGKTENVSFQSAYHLYTTADKYDVQQLKSFCTDYLPQNLTPINVCDIIMLADQYGDEGLMSSIQEFFNGNLLEILQSSEWMAMMKDKPDLANRLMTKMASSYLKRGGGCGEEHVCCKKIKGVFN